MPLPTDFMPARRLIRNRSCRKHSVKGKDEVMNIYVGNLSYEVTERDLQLTFGEFGTVESVKIIIDKHTDRSKGFGFVSFVDDAAADKAIAEMNKKEVEGRPLNVKEAIPFDENKPRRSFDRGRSGGRGGFGGRGRFNRGPRRDREFEESEEASEAEAKENTEMSEESSESEE